MKSGDKVICIDGNFSLRDGTVGGNDPVEGEVYTVAGTHTHPQVIGTFISLHEKLFCAEGDKQCFISHKFRVVESYADSVEESIAEQCEEILVRNDPNQMWK